jgi:formate hydrogenlyase subunit 4
VEIKRNFEELTITKRRFVIHQTPSVRQTTCAECGEPMLAIAQAAVLLGIKQSQIFQIVETGAAHFNEAEAGVLMICLPSLARALDPAE